MRHATRFKPDHKNTTKKPNTDFWHRLFAKKLPRVHFLAAVSVAIVLTVCLTILPSDQVEAKRQSLTIELPLKTTKAVTSLATMETPTATAAAVAVTTAAPKSDLDWIDVTVKSGDSLSTLFQRATLDASAVHNFINSNKDTKQLNRIMPGETLHFGLSNKGQLQQLNYLKSQLETWSFTLRDNRYESEHQVRQPELLATYLEAAITDSLFVDADKVGMPHGLIMELAGIFGWDVDFALDIRKGDSFSVLYDQEYLDGEHIGNGNILAAEFTNQGKTFNAVRYVASNGKANYYTAEGRSMRKAFLRTPVNFARVSSGFNMRRLHPITKTVRPHRGIDYAAPRGTPIFAAGDGKVIRAGYSRANGNYVVIQHGTQYSTKYLHMHKRIANKGQAVKQGQTIGTVGATGLATGPHLHYEFLVNGVHRNPRTVKFPQAKSIGKTELSNFLAQTKPFMAGLASNKSQGTLAQTKADADNNQG